MYRLICTVQFRPKRTFGTTRNINIPAEKPPIKTLPVKTVAKPKIPLATDKPKARDKTNIDQKKNQHVSFQDKENTEIVENKDNKGGECTPELLIKTSSALPETPYLTAENCSKCRFDKLETSAYWLNQIRVAEASGKHFVSATFFRLAFECNAQPLSSLRNELKHYMGRHRSVSLDIWKDVKKLYGYSDEELNDDSLDAVVVEKDDWNKSSLLNLLNSEAETDDECFEYDIVENSDQVLDSSNVSKATSGTVIEGFVHVNEMNKPLNCTVPNGRTGTSKLKKGTREQGHNSPILNSIGTSVKGEDAMKSATKKRLNKQKDSSGAI